MADISSFEFTKRVQATREFWDKVGILLPDYENSKDWLMQNGIRLDI